MKRNYAQCVTSEIAYQSILAEKEIKRNKLEIANQISLVKLEKHELRLENQKLVLENKNKGS